MPAPQLPHFNADRTLPPAVDVVVIGGGIIGASTALELVERGHSVLLCEKGQIAGEQSSRNWGWVRMSQRDPREMALMAHALDIWDTLDTRTGYSTGYVKSGILFTARSRRREAELARWATHLNDFDLGGHMLTGAALEAVAPGFGSRLRAGYHTPEDGRAEPQMATHAIAAAARDKGAAIITGCAVRALDVEAGRIRGVITEKGRVSATAVVLAGGAWSRLFLRNEGLFLPQLKVLNSVMRLSPVEGVPDTAIWAKGFAIRKRADGGFTVAAGGENTFDIVPDTFRIGHRFLPAFLQDVTAVGFRLSDRWAIETAEARPWGPQDRSPFEQTRVLDPQPSQKSMRRALVAARDAFPALAQADVTQSWGGLIDVTPDELPVISEVQDRPGLFLSTGYSGHGFGLGPAAGRLTADLVTGDTPIVDPRPFRLSRF
ncbi:NAD(P)/FAD-dependent oxidoreductase [Tritonibacter horizontis]|uniref:4-methylaminobutanoate oxidase (Formaldehyde-forming) n=1 Tax=Tritonibacter horizontis TaxID=1768241 RepID=A0A132BQF3_9RHOB|nr:FAD-binding oxidoreductase [Tritonibacter horizontis]KUP90638.1 4-methylaminobutanoate oxidase (formaldehyde-forming) [Tritonibacter horizontis]